MIPARPFRPLGTVLGQVQDMTASTTNKHHHIYTCTFLVINDGWTHQYVNYECIISQDMDTQISERYQSFCFVYKIKAAHCSNQSLH